MSEINKKLLFDMIPLRVIPPLILGLIVYPLMGLRSDAPIYFLRFLTALVMFNLTAASIALAISIAIPHLAISNIVYTLFVIFSMLFGGLLLNNGSKKLFFSKD